MSLALSETLKTGFLATRPICYVSSQHSQKLLGALCFKIIIWNLRMSMKEIHYLCKDEIENSILRDNHLPSLGTFTVILGIDFSHFKEL